MIEQNVLHVRCSESSDAMRGPRTTGTIAWIGVSSENMTLELVDITCRTPHESTGKAE